METPLRMELMEFLAEMGMTVQLELREKLELLETMAIMDPQERPVNLVKRVLLESRDKRDNKEMMDLRDKRVLRECVNLMSTILVTVTHIPSSDILKLPKPQNVLQITNLCGLDSLLCSSKATATDSHKILEAPDLASRSSN